MNKETNKPEYLYNSEYVRIEYQVEGKPNLVVVSNDNGELIVAGRDLLVKKEESWSYKRALERKKELEDITRKAQADIDRLVEDVIDKALASLAMRLKLNAVFSKGDGDANSWVIVISNELEKLIKEKAPKVVKGTELPF